MDGALLKIFGSASKSQDNLLNFILPAHEILWRVVFIRLIESNFQTIRMNWLDVPHLHRFTEYTDWARQGPMGHVVRWDFGLIFVSIIPKIFKKYLTVKFLCF